MRRLLARSLVLTLVSLIILGSCTAPKAPEGKILVEFWDYPRLPEVQQWLAEAIQEFERRNPDVHVEYTRLSWAKGGERLDIAAFAGRPPDVAGSVLTLKYVEAGLLQPVDRWLDEEIEDMPGTTYREDIHPEILKNVRWEGETYLFPWYKEGFILVLNKDLFAERGVPLPQGGQWTWAEFLASMRRLTFDRDGDGSADVYGIGYNTGKEKWEAFSFLVGEGMSILSEDGREVLIGSQDTIDGIRRLLDLEYREQVALPGAGGFHDDTTWTAFTGRDRRLAATCQGLWSINAVRIQNRQLEELRRDSPGATNLPEPLNIAVALFPIMPGHEQKMASYGVGGYMVFKRPKAPERTEAAARLARFLTLEAGQEINRAAGLFPSRRTYQDLLSDDPLYDDILEFLPAAETPPIHPAWPQLDQVISEHLQLALLRRITPEEAVRRMQERCEMVIDAYWKSHDAATE